MRDLQLEIFGIDSQDHGIVNMDQYIAVELGDDDVVEDIDEPEADDVEDDEDDDDDDSIAEDEEQPEEVN